MTTTGEALVQYLGAYGVDTVFGIPGVHTVELYRGLPNSRIRHVTPRHEQGAGFMADGYARVTGKPGVCFLITGPGVTNAATAMGQAYSDSIPLLVISAVTPTQDLGMGTGRLHELPDQRNVTSGYTVFSHTLLDPNDLPDVLGRAFSVFSGARPGPVHIELPTDVIAANVSLPPPTPVSASPPAPDPDAVGSAAELLTAARQPLLIVGGGAKRAGAEVAELAERTHAPMLLSLAAKGTIDEAHPLCLGAVQPFEPVRELVRQADVVVAIGTEFSETDRNLIPDPIPIRGQLIRIDIEAQQLTRNHRPDIAILSDASLAVRALNDEIGSLPKKNAAELVAQVKAHLPDHWFEGTSERLPVLNLIREVLPRDGILVTDSTQLAYDINHCFPIHTRNSFLTCTTGFGTLGYALPAGIGAKLAAPDKPVFAIAGDGGLLFSLSELAAAVEVNAALTVVVWNNRGYREIKDYMKRSELPEIGVDLTPPDFVKAAEAFGCIGRRPANLSELKRDLIESMTAKRPTVIDVSDKIVGE